MDIGYMLEVFPKLIMTLPITLLIITVSAIFGLLLSIGVTYLRLKKLIIIGPILETYVSFMRSTPILIQLFLVYYGLPVLMDSLGFNTGDFSAVASSIIALIIFNGAYLSEILRPAYLSVERGQHEAADSLGYKPFEKFRKVIFPQLAPIALPGLGNAVIYLVHDTSLIFTIGVIDVMGQAKLIIANTYGENKIEMYFVIAIIYWLVCLASDRMIKLLEHFTYLKKIKRKSTVKKSKVYKGPVSAQ